MEAALKWLRQVQWRDLFRDEFLRAIVIGCLGLAATARAVMVLFRGEIGEAIMLLLLAAFLAFLARFTWMSGLARWYSADWREWAIDRVSRACSLRGVTCTADWRIHQERMDLVADTASGRVVVTITDLPRWHMLHHSEQETALIDQTRRHMQAVGAIAGYIWLPRGRQVWWQRILLAHQRGDPRVIVGDDLRMSRVICKHHPRLSALRGVLRPRR